MHLKDGLKKYWKLNFTWFNLLLFIPLTTINYFAIVHILDLGITDSFKGLLIICFVFPALVFVLYFVLSKKKKINLLTDDQELIFTKRTTLFTVFISLFIFYATFFIGLLIFREKPLEGEIPYLKDGTIGMRAWQSRVLVKDVKIHYDSLGIWRLIPDSIVYNKNNWTETSWNHNKLNAQIESLEKLNFIKKIYYKIFQTNITIKDTVKSSVDPSSFIVQNCTLIFTPKGNYQKLYHNMRFDCKVTFEKINEPKNHLFPGFQIVSFIDTNKVVNEKGERDYSDLCLQFSLNMNNDHIPWIPALDYQPPTKFVSTANRMERFGNYDEMEVGKEYFISAVIIDDKALFLGNTNGSVKLFEVQLAKKAK